MQINVSIYDENEEVSLVGKFNIANRTKADITNIDLQRKAGNAFFQKYGANNMGAFKRAWADNADSRVFQAMNIYQDENLMPFCLASPVCTPAKFS